MHAWFFKFGRLETLCVDRRSKKLLYFVTLPVHVKTGLMYTLTHMSTLQGLSVHYETLEMNVDTKTKVLLKFGRLETLCVDRRSKKLLNLSHYRYM